MKKVQILMSTYNGEKYIKTQIDSILEQDYREIFLAIRDDGSTDHTVEILKQYEEKYKNISVKQEEIVGVILSFFELVQNADENSDDYAFSDQDDKWLKHKISRAVECLEKEDRDIPLLYCSNKILVDKELNPIHSEIDYTKEMFPSFGNALVQNICTGCTCVFNKKLYESIKNNIPNKIIMHDWWLYLVATAFGKVIYDKKSYILYRQHEGNVHGTIIKKRELLYHRWQELWKDRGEIYGQLEEFKRRYLLDIEEKELLEKVLKAKKGIKNKVNLMREKRVKRQFPKEDNMYRIMILLGKL